MPYHVRPTLATKFPTLWNHWRLVWLTPCVGRLFLTKHRGWHRKQALCRYVSRQQSGKNLKFTDDSGSSLTIDVEIAATFLMGRFGHPTAFGVKG